MSIPQRLGRPLLSGIFVYGGLDAARNPDTKVKAAQKVTQPLTEKVPTIPADTEQLVRLNGLVQVVAGTALAVGKFRRAAALALIGSVIPTTVAGHAFWEETDEQVRSQQMIHFLKNLGLLGGLIITAFDTEGAPSLSWRAKRKARRIGQAVSAGGAVAGTTMANATRSGRRAAAKAEAFTPAAVESARRQAKRSIETVGSQLQGGAERAGKLISAGTDRTGDLVSRGADRAGKLVSAGTDRTGDLVSRGADRAGKLVSAGTERTGDLVSMARNALPVG